MTGPEQHHTPMLRQYHEIKQQYPGTLLFFRLGDFYEMFFEDAQIGARELEITLTARHKESGSPVPMCGVPYHAAQGYIARLVRKGYRVAICEQTEDPGGNKKLVKREVVRVITPGTALENQLLESNRNNFLASVCGAGEGMGLAVADLSTGEFLATEFHGPDAWDHIREQLAIFSPSELIYPATLSALIKPYSQNPEFTNTLPATSLEDWNFGYEQAGDTLRSGLRVAALDGFGLSGKSWAVSAAGACLGYILETQKADAAHIREISYFEPSNYLLLDSTSLNNLEVVEGQENRSSLIRTIDRTLTSMGARLLRQWLIRPSVRIDEINLRLDSVDEFRRDRIVRDRMRASLSQVADLERLAGKITLNRILPRELIALRQTIDLLPEIRTILSGRSASLLQTLAENFDDLSDIGARITQTIADEPPAAAGEPGVIRDGYSAELDELRGLARSGKGYIAAIEARERERTGIGSLKVKFNNVFGYFLEISNTHRERVPADYERKQTLVNAERYTTPELKEYERKVLGAEERILEIENELFRELRLDLAHKVARIQGVARLIALTDVTSSLAEVADKQQYCRPQFHLGDEIEIKGGRHPIVEVLEDRFIPNDLYINNSTDRLLILTGPNMGGKSVFLKQAALICILGQAGSFVPAGSARLPLLDRIFTRVGASDNLARGRSTFMVEMVETANILNTATARSLILLDEVGRGTSTFDGLSLAWAIAEYLHDHGQHSSKTIFATHYHELTELSKMRPGVKNFQVAVSESGGEITFLRRVVSGSASKSYGIEVARLAGLPGSVVERAREILGNLEQNELDVTGKPRFARHLKKASAASAQRSFFDIEADRPEGDE